MYNLDFPFYQWYADHYISIIDYNLYSKEWWKGKVCILLRTYTNLCGESLAICSRVTISYPMQELRDHGFVHTGMFMVKGANGVEVGGVSYTDLILVKTK